MPPKGTSKNDPSYDDGYSYPVTELEKVDDKFHYTPETVESSNLTAPKGFGGKTNRDGSEYKGG